ncbi:arylsulfatase J-like [Lingula anatina]|uniref:Arylsulfatase J-like n=1 Tax=Lingula anatina TaxID=7574 RepID=A0A1S3INQ2_LINAN|nr:arylsulfatase J-like [Lingula anatina]|eukprot:XP_013399703.1 arylsulfatase J-like [Lingula anatina]
MGMGKALCLFVCLGAVFSQPPTKPNIVVVMLDDVGYNDVGWNNPHIKTPNLDKMAREGVTLNNSYSQPVCSPSRAALLTGRYPHNVNMDGAATFGPTIPDGLDLKYWILPQKLKELGYTTHAIGKWHLGFCDWKYTPTERGFDTFFGFYLGANDYFTHRTTIGKDGFDGLDLRFNKTLVTDKDGVYDTNMWSDRAVEIIKNHDKNAPFFVYVAYNGIHGPLRDRLKMG